VNALSVEALAREGRDQGRVHVQRTPFVAAPQLERRQEAEQQHEVGLVPLELGVERVVEGLAVAELLARDRGGRDAAPTRALEAARSCLRRQHPHDAPGHLAGLDAREQILEARPLA
jgi:hypothetical protein